MKKKFNAIDMTVILVILVVAIGSYLYFNNQDSEEEDFTIGKEKITFIVEVDNVWPEISEQIHVDDILLDNGRYQEAVVTKVDVFDHEKVIAVDGELKAVKIPTVKRVVVTIEATVNKYGPYMDLGGQEIKSSKDFWLRTDKMTMYGKVVTIL